MPTQSTPDMEYVQDVNPADEAENPDYEPPNDTGAGIVPYIAPGVAGVPKDLTVASIKKYINDKVTDEEAYVFLQLCKARGLNPFLKDAHLIKYDHVKPATIVVGKDAFMKRAEMHPAFNGIEAGIIIECKGGVLDEREGSFYLPSELTNIVGGWAKVHRKDRTVPTVARVAFSEYVGLNGQGQPNKIWGSKPATMIRKVAIVQALREAFTFELGGCYDQCEMGIEEVVE